MMLLEMYLEAAGKGNGLQSLANTHLVCNEDPSLPGQPKSDALLLKFHEGTLKRLWKTFIMNPCFLRIEPFPIGTSAHAFKSFQIECPELNLQWPGSAFL